ncbi:hypothetical protein SVIOM342S_08579 [Streptomyces violaceorubidus]
MLRRESIRERDGQRTSYAHPNCSNQRISRAEESSWPRITPCRAEVGSAWCRLCQDSPQDRIASHHTLPERSRDLKGRLPTAWQIELIDQVTWCSNATRTSEPQKNPVNAPHQDIVTSPPISAGSARDTTVHRTNWRETASQCRGP